jgi:hypothetical protein
MPRPSHRAVPLPAGPVQLVGPTFAALVPALLALVLSGATWVGILVWLGTAPVLVVTYRALSRPTLYVEHGGNADIASPDASIEELFACRPTSTRPKHRT